LCISTLHANNANQALDRIINFFPDERRPQLLMDLSSNLRAIISQRLIPTVDHKRIAAIEILLGTPTISELILRSEFDSIKEIMERSVNLGMQTFDNALIKLYLEGRITEDEAYRNADSANNVRLKIKLAAGNGENKTGGLNFELVKHSSDSESTDNQETTDEPYKGAPVFFKLPD
jgi:twitching motility protein PilU